MQFKTEKADEKKREFQFTIKKKQKKHNLLIYKHSQYFNKLTLLNNVSQSHTQYLIS